MDFFGSNFRGLLRLLVAFGIVWFFLYLNSPFLMPLILSGVFALGLNWIFVSLVESWRWSKVLAVSSIIGVGLLLFWIPLAVATYRVFIYILEEQKVGAMNWMIQGQNLKVWLIEQLKTVSDWIGFDVSSPVQALVERSLARLGEGAVAVSSSFFQQLPVLFVQSFVFVLGLFFFLSHGARIKSWITDLGLFSQGKTQQLINALQASSRITLFSTLVVGLVQALIIGLGSLLFSQGDFWLVVTLTFFISFIPVLGAAPLGYLLALLAYLDGNLGSAIGLAVVATLAGLVDNVLKPWLVRGEVQAPFVFVFTSVLGGVFILGVPGLILGPMALNLLVAVLPTLTSRDAQID